MILSESWFIGISKYTFMWMSPKCSFFYLPTLVVHNLVCCYAGNSAQCGSFNLVHLLLILSLDLSHYPFPDSSLLMSVFPQPLFAKSLSATHFHLIPHTPLLQFVIFSCPLWLTPLNSSALSYHFLLSCYHLHSVSHPSSYLTSPDLAFIATVLVKVSQINTGFALKCSV